MSFRLKNFVPVIVAGCMDAVRQTEISLGREIQALWGLLKLGRGADL